MRATGYRIGIAALLGIQCVLFILLMAGCRPSPALERLVYTQGADELAEGEIKLLSYQQDSPDETDSISPQQENMDSSDRRDVLEDLPVWNAAGRDARAASNVVFDINATGDYDTAFSSRIEQAQQEDSRNQPEDELYSDLDLGANLTQEEDSKFIVDAYGNYIILPSRINRISAVGEIAGLIHMLGGGRRLVATSQSFVENRLAHIVFGEGQVLAAEPLWHGEGAESLSGEGFSKLLGLSPDVCIEISGEETFSREQVAKLREANIAYVVLPQLNTTENISTAISVLADVLGGRDNQNSIEAPELAIEYTAFCEKTIAGLQERTKRFSHNHIDFDNDKYKYGVKYLPESEPPDSGKYTIFINEWDDIVHCRLYSDDRLTLAGRGAAIAYSGYSNSPLSYYMSLAGVINTPAIYQDYNVESKWYVSPLSPTTRILSFLGGFGTIQPTGADLTKVGNGVYLGSPVFPGIIVPSEYVKARILADPIWQYYGLVTSSSGMNQDYGFLDEDGSIVKSNIVGAYDVFVNPAGVGSWTSGSAESILQAVWVAWKFQDAYSEVEVHQLVTEFYRTFYRYALNDEDIALIMQGRVDIPLRDEKPGEVDPG